MIEDYIGKPFVDGGRGPDDFDCWGLVKSIYLTEFNIELPDYYISAMNTYLVSGMMMKKKEEEWQRVDDKERGNMIAISMDMTLSRSVVNHVGVYLGDGRFIHTRKKTGAVIERIDDYKWINRVEGFYTYGK